MLQSRQGLRGQQMGVRFPPRLDVDPGYAGGIVQHGRPDGQVCCHPARLVHRGAVSGRTPVAGQLPTVNFLRPTGREAAAGHGRGPAVVVVLTAEVTPHSRNRTIGPLVTLG